MITTVKTSSVIQGMPKYRSMLAGNSAYIPSSYESIATATGTGSSGTITFSSIPSGFKHLQIRGTARSTATNYTFTLKFNNDSGSNYAQHRLFGDGTSITASGADTLTFASIGSNSISTTSSNIIGVNIIDILDYGSTSKYKTVRSFAGIDDNSGTTASQVVIRSGLWQSTSAITQIDLIAASSGSWTTQTTFALYGIKEF